jgi:photosystem II stability/assembly factor-like uncharacterized protein
MTGFIAVGESGTILTSSKGTSTWFQQTSPGFADLYTIIYENKYYIAVGKGGNIYISPNNNGNWKRETLVVYELAKIIYGNNIFVTVRANGTVAVCDFAVRISLA